jgi:precorrin-6B methylase 2
MIDYHRELIADEVRTAAFRDAIRAVVRPGDVVIDAGCGSGILSLFALEAGAARVHAIELTHMADAAALLARHWGVADRLLVHHRHSSEVALPEPADVLISETIGTFGFDEGILGTVIDARRMLRPGARVIPQTLGIDVAPVTAPRPWETRIGWWNAGRFGADLSPLQLFASSALLFAGRNELTPLSAPREILSADLQEVASSQLSGDGGFLVEQAGTMHGLGVWFSAALAPGVVLTNRDPRITSWRHGLLPLSEPIELHAGDRVKVRVETADGKVWRWLGTAGSATFDQTSWLAVPPCTATES